MPEEVARYVPKQPFDVVRGSDSTIDEVLFPHPVADVLPDTDHWLEVAVGLLVLLHAVVVVLFWEVGDQLAIRQLEADTLDELAILMAVEVQVAAILAACQDVG